MKQKLIVFVVVITLIACTLGVGYLLRDETEDVTITDSSSQTTEPINASMFDDVDSFYAEMKPIIKAKLRAFEIDSDNLDSCEKTMSEDKTTKYLTIYVEDYLVSVMYYKDTNTIDIRID